MLECLPPLLCAGHLQDRNECPLGRQEVILIEQLVAVQAVNAVEACNEIQHLGVKACLVDRRQALEAMGASNDDFRIF